MDPQFEELAQRLKSELAPVIADQLKSELATVVADQVKSKLATVIAEQFAAAGSRLVGQYRIHAEEMKAEVKLAAEGYGATLEGIDRRLKELAVKWDTKIANHDLVLSDHAKRLENLEQRS